MKTLIVLALLLSVVNGFYLEHPPALPYNTSEESLRELFNQFKWKFNKVYADVPEEEDKFKLFGECVAKVNSLNDNARLPMFAISQLCDLSREQMDHKYSGLKNPKMATVPYIPVAPELPLTAPDSFDWRDYGAVTPVKDQQECNSCWAFSVIAALEGQTGINGILTTLSEQQLIDCDYNQEACQGGWTYRASKWLQDRGGAMAVEDYPDTLVKGTCQFDRSRLAARVTNIWRLPRDENQIKEYIYRYGPVSMAISDYRLDTYHGGDGHVDDPMYAYECPHGDEDINHAMAIVGYGVEESTGKPYWIIKNSWNTDWGVNGYYYLRMGGKYCGIEKQAVLIEGYLN